MCFFQKFMSLDTLEHQLMLTLQLSWIISTLHCFIFGAKLTNVGLEIDAMKLMSM